MPGKKPRMYFGTPEDERSKQSTGKRTPRMYIGQPEPTPALVQSVPYGSVILGLDTDTGQPISVSQEDLCLGTYIVGMAGMGKSSLLEQIAYQQMRTGEALIVIDPHGDMIDSIIAHMPAEYISKTYLLDLKDRDYPFGLNVFASEHPDDEEEQDATRNQLTHAFEKIWPDTAGQLYFNMLLRHLITLLIEAPSLTLADTPLLFRNAGVRTRYTSRLQNNRSREFWQEEYPAIPDTYKRPLLDRLDMLLSERVLAGIIKQTQKTLSIRTLIAERNILLVKLPVLEPAYSRAAEVVGTLLMAMVYAATFSFNALPQDKRPGFTLIVDEFENFVTDEYATLFEQGRKDKVKQFLAHQHRQQLARGQTQTGRTNLAATLSANTIIAFRTSYNSRELAPKFTGITARQRPTDIYLYPLEKIKRYPHPLVKQFVRDVVDKLKEARGLKLQTKQEQKSVEYPYRYFAARHERRETRVRRWTETSKVNPPFDFGAGVVETNPEQAKTALRLLQALIYESEVQGSIVASLRRDFLAAVTPFWKLNSDQDRATGFIQLLDTVLAILIANPIATDETVSNADIASLLEHLEKRHALVKVGSTAYQMETRDTRLLQEATTAEEATRRLTQVREQTRARYCVPRSELVEHEEEAVLEEKPEPPPVTLREEPEGEPIERATQEEEAKGEVPESEIPRPEPKATPEPEQPQPASRDSMNMLFTQLQKREVDPDTTILAALGEHYVLTIAQWMRLFELRAYHRATPYFKTLRELGYIYRKDREGRGGNLVSGDWQFLLTKGANELARRKQRAPLFKLEPNEAEKAAGDTLVHTSLVNEILIHLRLLERQYPGIITIEKLVHERSMRREYLAALGTDAKLYPDGFLRILVPTPNGLKKRYLFVELQHTTQKDKQNWQTKIRKYLDLFAQEDTLTQYFATKTPRVLVLVMDEEYITYHKQWTEEVLQQAGDKGKRYSNRFLIGSYDPGISDNTVPPLQFFCTPRFSVPFSETTTPLFYRVK